MDFEFSEEQEALRASVRRFVEERAPLTWVRDRYDHVRGTTDEVWQGLADLGVLGLLVPEARASAASASSRPLPMWSSRMSGRAASSRAASK